MRIIKSHKSSGSSIKGASMPPNPYDIGPADYDELKDLEAFESEFVLNFEEPILIEEDGSVELLGQSNNLDPAPNKNGYYQDENTGADILNSDDLFDKLFEELNDKGLLSAYGPGNYNLSGTMHVVVSTDNISYDEVEDDVDWDGQPVYKQYYNTDAASSKIVSFSLSDLVATPESDAVTSADIIVASEDDSEWEELRTKDVVDTDGMLTDYTLYVNHDGTQYICMYGDKDIYGPDPDYADWEGSSQEEAYEWFDSYNPEYDEDDDIYGADAVDSNEVTLAGERNYDGSHAFLLQSPVFDDYSYINKMRELLPNRIDSTGYSDEIAVFAEPDEKQTILDAIAAFNQSVLCARRKFC